MPDPSSPAPQTVELPQGPLQYREYGQGPPIVLIHGLLVNGLLWHQVVPALDERYRCSVPELPLGSHEVPMRPAWPSCSRIFYMRLTFTA